MGEVFFTVEAKVYPGVITTGITLVEALVQVTHVSGGAERTPVPHDRFHHPTTASTFRPPPTTSLQHDGGSGKMAIMHPDTTILMVSCAFMIIIGETNS